MEKQIKQLLAWYQKNKRMLPWRKDKDPYHVWISEIMLQQTRIEAVIPYYERFIKELPTIYDLANVKEEKLLKLWEGLGYYNRARNLKKAAENIVLNYNGIFPDCFEKILMLPGIGEYTASAIGSICFSLKEATVDGNVLRVYMRFYNCFDNIDEGITRKKVREHLMTLLPKEAGEFNEALMELGEMVCIPNGIPKCHLCPLQKSCLAKQNHSFMEIPVRSLKREKKNKKYTVLILKHKEKVAIHKRNEKGVLKDLWEFPMIEQWYNEEEVRQYLNDCSYSFLKIIPSISYIHIFTHLKWEMKSYIIQCREESDNYLWVDIDTLITKYALPSAFQPFLKEIKK